MGVEVRFITEEEVEEFRQTVSAGFGWEYRSEDLDRFRAITEVDRNVAAFDGTEMVGTGGAFSYRLTVPGGSLGAAGITAVSVLPTHRRRGLLTLMMREMLDQARERREALAILWASESSIYGRFGYGIAAEGIEWTLDRVHARFRHPPAGPGLVRLVSREEALELWPTLYEQGRRDRPGTVDRTRSWWEHHTLHDPEHWRDGYTPYYHALYEESGRPLGYVRYRFKHDWPEGLPSAELAVGELVWTDAASYAALWSYVFGVDLVGTIKAWNRPVDEPLPWMLADSRRLRRRLSDSLWCRLVDVPAALAGRRYSVEGRLVLEVSDPSCHWNEGRFELTGGPGGAECRPTGAEPDLRLGAEELGAVYLGRPLFDTLARAGRVEGTPGALRRADLMFSWQPAPWSIEVF